MKKENNAKPFNAVGSLLFAKIMPIPESKMVTVKKTTVTVTQA